MAPGDEPVEIARAIAHEMGHMRHTREPDFGAEWLGARHLAGTTDWQTWVEDYAEVFAALYGPKSDWRAPTPRPSPTELDALRSRFFEWGSATSGKASNRRSSTSSSKPESRPEVDQDLAAQLSELRRGVDSLATLEGSARELRTAVASISEDVRSLDAAVRASSQQQAGLAEDLVTLKDQVTRLAKRVPARPHPTRLEDGQIEALANAVVAAAPRPRTTKKAPSAAPAAATPATLAAAGRAGTTRAKKAAATRTVSPSKTVQTPPAPAGSKRQPVKASKGVVKQTPNAGRRSSPASRAPSRPRNAPGTN